MHLAGRLTLRLFFGPRSSVIRFTSRATFSTCECPKSSLASEVSSIRCCKCGRSSATMEAKAQATNNPFAEPSRNPPPRSTARVNPPVIRLCRYLPTSFARISAARNRAMAIAAVATATGRPRSFANAFPKLSASRRASTMPPTKPIRPKSCRSSPRNAPQMAKTKTSRRQNRSNPFTGCSCRS